MNLINHLVRQCLVLSKGSQICNVAKESHSGGGLKIFEFSLAKIEYLFFSKHFWV